MEEAGGGEVVVIGDFLAGIVVCYGSQKMYLGKVVSAAKDTQALTLKHDTINIVVASAVGVSPRNNIVLSVATQTRTHGILRGFIYSDAMFVRN